ncbi:serine/threonine-protein phosphatase 6 regulatory ankyrin repeat subunit C-like isoform X2 [Homarus americanus]|uniref:serine/threonine-protein phosphatase 6 regulatory ankyrin repeat subunit C-like isoform X2 n=1 Tax=Homarus americanus TaxID=6706 RepID=UPI001C484085|nr:serine/threonine-protein phosphatase 6 regulatory ankyrin repeat subunit C-like isoform X2 [Homarus americanus]
MGLYSQIMSKLAPTTSSDSTSCTTRMKPSERVTEVLKKAVICEDEVMVSVALALGADPCTTEWVENGNVSLCLLSIATINGAAHLVPLLVEAGAPVDGSETTLKPIHLATHRRRKHVLRALLAAGANVEAKDVNGWTTLHIATYKDNESCLKTLLDANADINSKGGGGVRPLHHAAICNNIRAVKQLLRRELCDRHAVDNTVRTALHHATSNGSLEVTQHLVEAGLDLSAKDKLGQTPLDLARLAGHELVEWWLRKLPCHGPAAEKPTLDLMKIYWKDCANNYEEALKDIKDKDSGVSTYMGNQSLTTSIHLQDASGRTILHWMAEVGNIAMVRYYLIYHHLYHNVVTWAGETPADLARRAGHGDVLSVFQDLQHSSPGGRLLYAGAPLESPSGSSTQPLPLAITSNRREMVSLLLAAGAPLTTTCNGLNLLTLAWLSPDVTPPVQVIIIRAFIHVLKWERTNLTHFPEVEEGVGQLILTMRCDNFWQASWPNGGSVFHLTELMVQAVRTKCTLTCSFIHEAGGHASLCTKSGVSPLHAALEVGHWNLARQMIKNMGGCLYVADFGGRLPTTMMPSRLRQHLEQNIYNKERIQLEDLHYKIKDKVEKHQMQKLLRVQKNLITTYWDTITGNTATTICQEPFNKAQVLLIASQGGMLQLIYLLVKVGGVEIDTQVDPTNGTTAIHQAASHGKSGCVLLLLSLGADPLLEDRYRQTGPHLAAMFGHQKAFELFRECLDQQEPSCRAGTTPTDVKNNFSKYLKMYNRCESNQEHIDNNPTDATINLLKRTEIRNLVKNAQKVTVDYTKGEAQEVKEVITKEMTAITDKVADIDSTYTGTLTLLGSTADSTRLYYPDEFDFNLTLKSFSDVTVRIIKQTKKDVLLSGHKLKIEIETENPSLQGNRLMSNLYDRVRESLNSYVLQDDRLSLVPPGVTRTQVGLALSLAWQGSEYPLLLVDIDLVPVLSVPWPKEIMRPPLTPVDSQMIHLSNTGDAKWRCSFAATEVEVVKKLAPQERQVFLTGKTLLSYMKAELWMPRDVKNQFSWWDSRYWSIPIPAGFCFKNSFLKLLQVKRENKIQWKEGDTMTHVTEVFEIMCLKTDDTKHLVPAKVHAYFGGDYEKPKVGEGAPLINEFLKKSLTKLSNPKVGFLGFKQGFLR